MEPKWNVKFNPAELMEVCGWVLMEPKWNVKA